MIYRRGKEEAKRANSAVFFILAALTFVNVPGVSRIAVKVKVKVYQALAMILNALVSSYDFRCIQQLSFQMKVPPVMVSNA